MYKIHVIGDSYSQRFEGDVFINHFLQGATAYNLINNNSSTQSKKKLFNIIFNLNKNDNIMLCFGEIDIKSHIFKHLSEYKDLNDAIEKCVNNYTQCIEEILYLGYKNLIVFGVVPTTPKWEANNHTIFGTEEERNKATEYFNVLLEQFCKKNNIKFVSIFYYLINEGYKSIAKSYQEDMVHIKPDIQTNLFNIEYQGKYNDRF